MADQYYPNGKPEPCFWCHKDCGGTCLGVNNAGGSVQMIPEDPAYFLLKDGYTSKTTVTKRDSCYICRDPEFAQMGLSLCQPCPQCSKIEIEGGAPATQGHIPADDPICDDCGYDLQEAYEQEQTS